MNEWKLVPVEPTMAMLDAACELDAHEAALAEMVAEYKRAGLTYSSGVVPMERELTVQYRAMLAAAPTPPAEAVTDAMVEAALDACARDGDEPWRHFAEAVVTILKEDMRRAITAALAAKEGR